MKAFLIVVFLLYVLMCGIGVVGSLLCEGPLPIRIFLSVAFAGFGAIGVFGTYLALKDDTL